MRMLTRPSPPVARKECAAIPAKSARAGSPLKINFANKRCRAKRQGFQSGRALSDAAANATLAAGTQSTDFSQLRASGFHQAPICAPNRPAIVPPVTSMFFCKRQAAEPSSSGCASGISGSIHSRPKRSSGSVLKKRRACCKWVNCRTDVMQKARQSKFGRTGAPPPIVAFCFVNKNGTSRAPPV